MLLPWFTEECGYQTPNMAKLNSKEKKTNVLIVTYTDKKKIKEIDKEPTKDGRKDKIF